MNIFYTSDGELDTMMTLDELLGNFAASKTPHHPDDIREALSEATRGWYSGTHDCGQYLILNFDKFALMPDALDAYHAARVQP